MEADHTTDHIILVTIAREWMVITQQLIEIF